MHLRSCVVNISVLRPTRHIISYHIIISGPSSQRGFDARLENCVANILAATDNVPLSSPQNVASRSSVSGRAQTHSALQPHLSMFLSLVDKFSKKKTNFIFETKYPQSQVWRLSIFLIVPFQPLT